MLLNNSKLYLRRVIGESLYLWLSWKKMKIRHFIRLITGRDPLIFKDISVPVEKHGEWYLYANKLNNKSIIYSLGIGKDISFDLSLIKKYGCQIFAFDPTPSAVSWIEKTPLPIEFHVFQLGVAAFDGTANFCESDESNNPSFSYHGNNLQTHSIKCEVRKLSTLMKMIGHNKIDLLKMDIEGAEYEVIECILKEHIDINQIVVEFHHRKPWIGAKKTRTAVKELKQAGYKLFKISETGHDFCFIKANCLNV